MDIESCPGEVRLPCVKELDGDFESGPGNWILEDGWGWTQWDGRTVISRACPAAGSPSAHAISPLMWIPSDGASYELAFDNWSDCASGRRVMLRVNQSEWTDLAWVTAGMAGWETAHVGLYDCGGNLIEVAFVFDPPDEGPPPDALGWFVDSVELLRIPVDGAPEPLVTVLEPAGTIQLTHIVPYSAEVQGGGLARMDARRNLDPPDGLGRPR